MDGRGRVGESCKVVSGGGSRSPLCFRPPTNNMRITVAGGQLTALNAQPIRGGKWQRLSVAPGTVISSPGRPASIRGLLNESGSHHCDHALHETFGLWRSRSRAGDLGRRWTDEPNPASSASSSFAVITQGPTERQRKRGPVAGEPALGVQSGRAASTCSTRTAPCTSHTGGPDGWGHWCAQPARQLT